MLNLAKFPDVCRVCMKPESKELMHSLDSIVTGRGHGVAQFLDDVTYCVSAKKAAFVPRMICVACLDEVERFAVYRSRLLLTLQFMEALVDFKESNSSSLCSLFANQRNELITLFKDLSLSDKEDILIEDLLQEFESYDFFAGREHSFCIKQEPENDDKMSSAEESSSEQDCDEDYSPPDDGDSDDDALDLKPIIKIKPNRIDNIRKALGGSAAQPKAKSAAAAKRGRGTGKRGRPRVHPDGTFLKVPWSCDKCKFVTKYRVAVERHKGVHLKRENRMYPCAVCDQVFKSYDELRTHSVTHPENRVVCEVCGVALGSWHSLKAHMERHEETQKYSCEYCDYATNTKLSLKAHMNVHNEAKLDKRCEVCGMVFRTASRLKRHMEGHNNERKYPCEQCPVRFNTANALRNHFTRVHLAIRYACEHCDKTYDQKIALRDHIEKVHQIQCNFVCDICVIILDSQEKLDTHMQRHVNPKPMECKVCLKIHLNQAEFDAHQCITYLDSYNCCNKDLRNHVQYNNHMLTKHGMKTNARVKPVPGMLLGQVRGARKRLEQCRKCDIAFPTRAQKIQHLAICGQAAPDQLLTAEGGMSMGSDF